MRPCCVHVRETSVCRWRAFILMGSASGSPIAGLPAAESCSAIGAGVWALKESASDLDQSAAIAAAPAIGRGRRDNQISGSKNTEIQPVSQKKSSAESR
jgi:hypothetical protein